MQSTSTSQFLIAATSSGCGKTTITLGLLRALKRRGMHCQSYKSGPDYIDPKYHELASGRRSINLDLYMMSPQHIAEVYHRHAEGAEALVVEGVMGLFDGYSRMEGSSASLATLLGIPVVLVVDAGSAAYSVGATLYGYKHFCPEVEVAGVIFNRVASDNHYRFLREAAEDVGIHSLGYLPKSKEISVPSRHLGLSLQELETLDYLPEQVAQLLEQHVNIDSLLAICQRPTPQRPQTTIPILLSQGLHIGIAQDEAFNFVYPENIKRLAQLGELSFFSPMRDTHLPGSVDLIYLPGGYPEFYLSRLSNNSTMRQSIRCHAQRGGKILAECGGMMYLCTEIVDEQGQAYPMCGVLDERATMQGMKLTLGYRTLDLQGITLRGHEFHYSHIEDGGSTPTIGKQYNIRGGLVNTPLYAIEGVRAGYTHLYWAESNPLDLWL